MGISNIAILFPEREQDAELAHQMTVTDIGNDQFSISGPDDMVDMVDEYHYQLNSPGVTLIGDDMFTAASG